MSRMRGLVSLGAVLAGLALLPGGLGFAQQGGSDVRKEIEALKAAQARMQRGLELKKDLDALKEGQAQLKKELQELKALLQARPATAPSAPTAAQGQTAVLTVDNAPFKGENNAKVTLVDFTDYQ